MSNDILEHCGCGTDHVRSALHVTFMDGWSLSAHKPLSHDIVAVERYVSAWWETLPFATVNGGHSMTENKNSNYNSLIVTLTISWYCPVYFDTITSTRIYNLIYAFNKTVKTQIINQIKSTWAVCRRLPCAVLPAVHCLLGCEIGQFISDVTLERGRRHKRGNTDSKWVAHA